MIDRSVLNIRALVRSYLVANTPGYLWRHFRADFSVKDLANRYAPVDLAQTITEVDDTSVRTVEDVAVAYAALIALSFKSDSEVRPVLASLERVRNLEWVKPLLDTEFDTEVGTQVTTMTVPVGTGRGRGFSDAVIPTGTVRLGVSKP